MMVTVKHEDMECNPGAASTAGDNEAIKPLSNAMAVCIAASEADSQAKERSQSTAGLGCVLCGVAIMISGIGFSIMSRNAPLSPPNGPRPPTPPQQPSGQFPPGQPYPHPPQVRPQS